MPSLRILAKKLLNINIQEGEHSSVSTGLSPVNEYVVANDLLHMQPQRAKKTHHIYVE